MSTHSEKVWVVIRPKTVSKVSKEAAIRKAVTMARREFDYNCTWEDLHKEGYSCVRATLTWEEPDE